MIFTLGEYVLEVNVEENKNYYKYERYVSAGCECDGCQNYETAVEKLSQEVSNLFNQLGLDIRKPAEVYVNYSENNILCYGGFYHICGMITKGESPWEVVSKTKESMTSHLNEEKMIDIDDNFKVGFQEECALINNKFPRPCIQMEILAYLPWSLDKTNTYKY